MAREFRRRAATICSDVADGIAAVPLPATLDELSAGYFDIFPVLDDASERFDDLHAPDALAEPSQELEDQLEDIRFEFSEVRTTAELRELDDGETAIADGEETLATIDELSDTLGVSECSAPAFGAEHFANATALFAAERQAQAPTGDFVTDANAICAQFGEDIADAPLPTDPVNFQLYVSSLSQAYELLGRDLDALIPPAGSEAQVDELVATIDEAVAALRRATTAAANADEKDVARLQQS